ncbi:MAG: hypothetical protein J0651_03740, partial [Actinobacteria bacterium]|nr:hypothetical protein [Actinomycetota bacterium]
MRATDSNSGIAGKQSGRGQGRRGVVSANLRASEVEHIDEKGIKLDGFVGVVSQSQVLVSLQPAAFPPIVSNSLSPKVRLKIFKVAYDNIAVPLVNVLHSELKSPVELLLPIVRRSAWVISAVVEAELKSHRVSLKGNY